MVVIRAGGFPMSSSPAEQQWAATHGGTLKSVADEWPQHAVTLQSSILPLGSHVPEAALNRSVELITGDLLSRRMEVH
jgi:hypothetical protein